MEQRAVPLQPSRQHDPVMAVPLLDFRRRFALVVIRRQLDWAEQPDRPKFGDTLRCDVEMLGGPLALRRRQRPIAELLVGRTQDLGIDDGVDESCIIIDRSEL